MSFDAGGLAQMTYNTTNNNTTGHGFSSNAIGLPGSGFAGRGPRVNPKRLSVALPPKVAPINENSVDNPTPRTSRSHLLAGLRTQPKTPAVPASAPYHQSQYPASDISTPQWNGGNNRTQGVPHSATGAGFDLSSQYAMNAARQMYALPEQVLAPPSVYEQEEMDPSVLQQMQMHSMFLAQRQQQLQQQLANITAATQTMGLNGNPQRASYHQSQGSMSSQMPQNFYAQQQQQQQQQSQVQTPIEVPGQPGVYLVYNPAIQGYSYAIDQNYQQNQNISQYQQQQPMNAFAPARYGSPSQGVNISPPATERSTPIGGRSFTPPKKAGTPPAAMEHVEPLPPPSATAFRRGHKKASSLVINSVPNVSDGPKTSSNAVFGSQRTVFPPTPMTGTFGPGAARAGEHPIRQPRGPPPLEELTAAPTNQHEGSKNFATRQRRRAVDSLLKAGTVRRAVSRSPGGSPVSERDCHFPDDVVSVGSNSSRKLSPIGTEMKEKRGSNGSSDGYFALSSASSSETEDWKQPPTPATPSSREEGGRKKMMLGVLNAAEKRKSTVY